MWLYFLKYLNNDGMLKTHVWNLNAYNICVVSVNASYWSKFRYKSYGNEIIIAAWNILFLYTWIGWCINRKQVWVYFFFFGERERLYPKKISCKKLKPLLENLFFSFCPEISNCGLWLKLLICNPS